LLLLALPVQRLLAPASATQTWRQAFVLSLAQPSASKRCIDPDVEAGLARKETELMLINMLKAGSKCICLP
jgi:hypothetical protein